MGPGRLTGMNATTTSRNSALAAGGFNGARSIDRDERQRDAERHDHAAQASMGPGRLTGMNAPIRKPARATASCFNGARSIDRDERSTGSLPRRRAASLQWGPVD